MNKAYKNSYSSEKILFLVMSATSMYRREVYVYDSEAVRKEEDDPLDAILFCYPFDISDDHAIFTCGHIMSTIKCCQDFFSESPK